MAEEKSILGSGDQDAGKLPIILGVVSILTVVILLVCTQWLFDASVFLSPLLCAALVIVSMIPFAFVKMSKKTATIGSVVAFLATLVLAFLLFHRRNKVTKIWITSVSVNEELAKKIMAYMSPSGVVVIASTKNTPITAELAGMDVNSPELKGKVAERLQAGAKKASKKNDTKGTGKPDYDKYLKEADLMDILQATRLSGIQQKMILNLTGPASAKLADDAARKKYGFIKLE